MNIRIGLCVLSVALAVLLIETVIMMVRSAVRRAPSNPFAPCERRRACDQLAELGRVLPAEDFTERQQRSA